MATYQSNIITATAPAKWFTTDKSTFGYVHFADATTLLAGDIIALCLIPTLSQITDFVICVPQLESGSPAQTVALQDDAPSSTPYTAVNPLGVPVAGPVGYVAATAISTGLTISTKDIVPASLGTSYTAQQQLNLLVAGTSGGAVSGAKNLYFRVTFSPT